MPGKIDPERPRTTVWRDDRYWFSRTQAEWKEGHALSRKHLEKSYERCAAFLSIDHFRFGRDRQTHYSLDFSKLRGLIEEDQWMQSRLNRPVTGCEKAPEPVAPERAPEDTVESDAEGISGCSYEGPASPVNSLEKVKMNINNTGCAGGVSFASSTKSEPGSRLPAQPEDGFPVQEILVHLQKTAGRPWEEKKASLGDPALSRLFRLTVGYLLIWQDKFEEEHQGGRHHFNASHVASAYALARQDVTTKRFSGVLDDAWTVRGVSQPADPLFLCRNHSRKFGLFCRHFVRMEDEHARNF